jgi:hypothetical protein
MVSRAVVAELSVGPVAAAEASAHAVRELVRPTLATVAFSARARVAWQRARGDVPPDMQQRLVAEGGAWADRATRAARSLQRVLPPPTDDDRALRALLRTALGALKDAEPGQLVAIQAMQQVEEAGRALAAQRGIPLAAPFPASGRSDIPGFLARFSPGTQKSVMGAVLLLLTATVVGFVYLAMRAV